MEPFVHDSRRARTRATHMERTPTHTLTHPPPTHTMSEIRDDMDMLVLRCVRYGDHELHQAIVLCVPPYLHTGTVGLHPRAGLVRERLVLPPLAVAQDEAPP